MEKKLLEGKRVARYMIIFKTVAEQLVDSLSMTLFQAQPALKLEFEQQNILSVIVYRIQILRKLFAMNYEMIFLFA